jgi:hypothetical protein
MTSSTPASVRSARFAVGLLLAINLFNYLDRYVLAAVESRISDSLLANDPNRLTKMGTLATAFIISYMVTALIARLAGGSDVALAADGAGRVDGAQRRAQGWRRRSPCFW